MNNIHYYELFMVFNVIFSDYSQFKHKLAVISINIMINNDK